METTLSNLKPKRKDGYVYRSADQGEAIQVEVYYSKGGANYFSGSSDPRGVWLSIMPVTLEGGMMSCVIGQGMRMFLAPCGRLNPKTILSAAVILDSVVPLLADTYKANGTFGDQCKQMVRYTLEKAVAK